MNIARNLLVVVGLAVPAWGSYILLPSDPGQVITEAIHSDLVFGHPTAAQSVDQSSAAAKTTSNYDLETLRQAISLLEFEIVALKAKLKKLSMNNKSGLVQSDSADETVKNREPSTEKNVTKLIKPDKTMRQQRMELIETNFLNENINDKWVEETGNRTYKAIETGVETEELVSTPLVNLQCKSILCRKGVDRDTFTNGERS